VINKVQLQMSCLKVLYSIFSISSDSLLRYLVDRLYGKYILSMKMPKKLIVDESFTPCELANEGDAESYNMGIFKFNITKLISVLNATNYPTTTIVSNFIPEHSVLNEAHVDSVDLDLPVIVAEISPETYEIIDGNHRVEKARRENINTLPCFKIDGATVSKYLTSKKAYISYIEFWNSKVEDY